MKDEGDDMYIGRLLVLSGPSGAGKGTICKALLEKDKNIKLSVSMTTRKPRPQETEGVNYYFVNRDEFEGKIADGGFLEYAQVFENYYGTPRDAVIEDLNAGRDVILEIDTQGAIQIKEAYPEAVFIFILPPSMEELKRRITNRGTEDARSMRLRLSEALREIEYVDKYDYAVVNDYLEEAVENVMSIIRAEHLKVTEDIRDIIDRI